MLRLRRGHDDWPEPSTAALSPSSPRRRELSAGALHAEPICILDARVRGPVDSLQSDDYICFHGLDQTFFSTLCPARQSTACGVVMFRVKRLEHGLLGDFNL